jgi:cytochrome d ubiquinol oxidase subunit I
MGIWMAMAPLGYVATEMGWVTREVGRQPWIIYGWMRTQDGASILPAAAVGSTLAMYCVVYTLLPLAAGWFYYKIIAKGADLTLAPPAPHPRQGG